MGSPGPISCIPSTSMSHEYVIMLLGDESIDLLVEETENCYETEIEEIVMDM